MDPPILPAVPEPHPSQVHFRISTSRPNIPLLLYRSRLFRSLLSFLSFCFFPSKMNSNIISLLPRSYKIFFLDFLFRAWYINCTITDNTLYILSLYHTKNRTPTVFLYTVACEKTNAAAFSRTSHTKIPHHHKEVPH